jgi:hypothetical protein
MIFKIPHSLVEKFYTNINFNVIADFKSVFGFLKLFSLKTFGFVGSYWLNSIGVNKYFESLIRSE